MSPTRRDILKTMIATPVVTLLPSSVDAHPVTQDPIHLIGQGTFWDRKANPSMIWQFFEVRIDDAKAVFRVKNPFDETAWEEVTYEDPSVIAAFRTVSQMLHVEWEIPA